MSNQTAAITYPQSIAKPTTADETQLTEDGPRFKTAWKCASTKSQILTVAWPDTTTGELVLRGPGLGGASIHMDTVGQIYLISGNLNGGADVGKGAGKLTVHCNGGIQKYEGPVDMEFNSSDDDEDDALGIMCYGNVTENIVGGQKTVIAQKVYIKAEELIEIVGGTDVKIQAGGDGSGSIIFAAGEVMHLMDNEKKIVLGQSMKFGVKEATEISFDPRSNHTILSPGHLNHKVLGDYKQWTGGIYQQIIGGIIPAPYAFVQPRLYDYSVTTVKGKTAFRSGQKFSVDAVLGGIDMEAYAGDVAMKATAGKMDLEALGVGTLKATGGVTIEGDGDVDITTKGKMDITSTGPMKIKGSTMGVEADGSLTIDGATVDVTGSGDVSIKGSMIFLN